MPAASPGQAGSVPRRGQAAPIKDRAERAIPEDDATDGDPVKDDRPKDGRPKTPPEDDAPAGDPVKDDPPKASIRKPPMSTAQRRGLTLATMVGYLLPSLWIFRHTVAHLATTSNLNGLGDNALFIWWLGWVPHALSTGQSPLYTHLVNAPGGASALSNTSCLLLGLLLAPVTLTVNAVASYNVVLILSPALSAFTAHLWLRRWVRRPLAAVPGALVFGYSPMIVAASLGHPNISCQVLIPVIALLVEDIVFRSPQPEPRRGAMLGLVVAAQYFISTELLFVAALGGIGLLLALMASHPRQIRERVWAAGSALAAALLVAGGLLAIPLLQQFSQRWIVRGPYQNPDKWVNAPVDLVSAPSTVLLHTRHSAEVSARLTNASEVVLYTGIPLLVLLVAITVTLRRRRGVLVAVALAVVFGVLSFGAALRSPQARGQALPWAWAQHGLPLADNVLPNRLGLIVWLAIAWLIAVALDEWWGASSGPRVRTAVCAAVAVSLVPLLPTAVPTTGTRVSDAPSFFTTAAVNAIPPDSTTLLVPVPGFFSDSRALLWQAAARYRFAQVGCGYALPRGPSHHVDYHPDAKVLWTYLHAPQAPSWTARALTAARRELAAAHVSTVVVGGSPYYPAEVRAVRALVGRPPDLVTGGVSLWHLRR
ncbi:MAG: hypothetical protein DLM57_02570 [Pseudonocardiales bacterium]|nr:MAG: hypothetical protein DLM57_02570 [Pseudonocardiales bacterium]